MVSEPGERVTAVVNAALWLLTTLKRVLCGLPRRQATRINGRKSSTIAVKRCRVDNLGQEDTELAQGCAEVLGYWGVGLISRKRGRVEVVECALKDDVCSVTASRGITRSGQQNRAAGRGRGATLARTGRSSSDSKLCVILEGFVRLRLTRAVRPSPQPV